MTVHDSATIFSSARIVPGTHLEIGARCMIGDFCLVALSLLEMKEGAQINSGAKLTGMGEVFMGQYSTIGYDTHLITASDTPRGRYMNDRAPDHLRSVRRGPIYIGDGAFVGGHCTVMPGVTIGSFAVVGSGAYIDRDVEPRTVVYPKQVLVKKRRSL